MLLRINEPDECTRNIKQFSTGVNELSTDVHKLVQVLGELTDVGNNFGKAFENLVLIDKIMSDADAKAAELNKTMERFIADYDLIQNAQLHM